jgi:hypothetical protein
MRFIMVLLYDVQLTSHNLQSSVLPVLSGWVLVLLKLLLATVTATAGNPTQSVPGFPPGVSSRMYASRA